MIKKLLLIVVVAVAYLGIMAAPLALADSNGQIFGACQNSQVQNSTVCANKNTTTNPVVKVIKTASNVIAAAAGVAAVIIIIISGLMFVSSGGSAEAAANAKKQLTHAVVGVVIIALAWVITRFVVDVII